MQLDRPVPTDQGGHRVDVQRTQGHDLRAREWRTLRGPSRRDHEQPLAPPYRELQPLERARSGEMDVLDHHHCRAITGGPFDGGEQAGEQRRLTRGRIGDGRRTTDVGA